MMHPIRSLTGAAAVAALLLGSGPALEAQAPAGKSPAKAKELAALMKSKQVEVYAAREPGAESRFVAVMLVPDVQMLVVSAAYSRPTDIEYWMYQKDYRAAYRDLASGALGTERFFVEDILGDGLVAVPAKNGLPDTVTINGDAHVLEGPADPKKRNDTRMAAADYTKLFGDADTRYSTILDGLIAALKK